MNAILLSLFAFSSTSAGGLLALRFSGRLHLVLGFTAGVLLGVVSFELLPETFALAHRHGSDPQGAMIAMVGGFLAFHALQRYMLARGSRGEGCTGGHHPTLGLVSAIALVGHSVMDGIGIGLAFQVSPTMGAAVAVAVIAHDFCDGLNTMSVMLLHGNGTARALAMLALDAAAPIVGAVSTLAFSAPPEALVGYLGFFAGFLLYVGATDILPRAQSRAGACAPGTLVGLTVLGASLPYVVVRLAS